MVGRFWILSCWQDLPSETVLKPVDVYYAQDVHAVRTYKVSLLKQYSGKWMYTHTVRKEVAGEMVETRTNVSRQIYDQLLAQVDHNYHQDWWNHVNDDVFREKFTTMG